MTPAEIRGKTFEKKMGGYRAEEVDAYLAEIASFLEKQMGEKEDLEQKIEVLAEKVEEYREDEDSLRAALIGAQKLGDSVVREAKKKAEMILGEATVKSEKMMSEATSKSEKMVAEARGSIDREAIALKKIQGQVAEFKGQILSMYKRHIEVINAMPDEPSLPRDVQQIVEKASSRQAEVSRKEVATKASTQEKELQQEKLRLLKSDEDPDSFDLSFEELKAAGESDVKPEEFLAAKSRVKKDVGTGKHKRGEFGTLRFGEEYTLTRNDE